MYSWLAVMAGLTLSDEVIRVVDKWQAWWEGGWRFLPSLSV